MGSALIGLSARRSYADDDYLSSDYKQKRRDEADPSELFGDDLAARIPGLGLCWLVPPNTLLLDQQVASWTYILETEFRFRKATYSRPLSGAEATRLARSFPDVVCDPSQQYYAYRTPHPVHHKTIVLGMPTQPPNITVGMHRGSVPVHIVSRDFQVSKVHRVRAQQLTSPSGQHRFVQYAAYNRSPDEIRRMSVVLYSRDWSVLARQDTEIPPDSGWCDGCAVPTYAYGLEYAFGTFNMLSLRDFPFPLLLANTSTIESRSLTLSSFREDRKLVSCPMSQFVTGCPSFHALMQEG